LWGREKKQLQGYQRWGRTEYLIEHLQAASERPVGSGEGKKNDYRATKGGGEGSTLLSISRLLQRDLLEVGKGKKTITGLPKVGRGEGSTSLDLMRGLVAGLLCRVGEKMNPQKLLLC